MANRTEFIEQCAAECRAIVETYTAAGKLMTLSGPAYIQRPRRPSAKGETKMRDNLVARINRKLAKDGKRLHTAKGAAAHDLGKYYICENWHTVDAEGVKHYTPLKLHVDVNELARELGV